MMSSKERHCPSVSRQIYESIPIDMIDLNHVNWDRFVDLTGNAGAVDLMLSIVLIMSYLFDLKYT